MKRIKASLSNDHKWIKLDFPHEKSMVSLLKTVPGAHWTKAAGWRCYLNLRSGRDLRETFGYLLDVDEALHQWGIEQVAREKGLGALAQSSSAALTRVPETNPRLAEWLRGYQKVGASFMAKTNCINADDPGTGKTVQTVAAILEAGLVNGPHLVIAPKSTLKSVWKRTILEWIPNAHVCVWSGDTPQAERVKVPAIWTKPEPYFLICTPDTLRRGLPTIVVEWNTITFDEYHKMGLANPTTVLAKAARKLRGKRKWALSGTPMGGKPLRLWGCLRWLDPVSFSNKWTWINQWLSQIDTGFGKEVGNVIVGKEEEFYQALAPYMIRRRKSEIATELPPKQFVDVLCDMTPAQSRQYQEMAAEAMVKVQDDTYSSFDILSLYSALGQIANAKQEIINERFQPTRDSGKLPFLLERLEEREGEQFIVSSQSKKYIKLVADVLRETYEVCLLTGDTPQDEREAMVADFQEGVYDVICMTTTAGGVGLTLDAADSVHVLDQTWDPDDTTQLTDRAHRISKIHNVTCYIYRSVGSIDEHVEDIVTAKDIASLRALDVFRPKINL